MDLIASRLVLSPAAGGDAVLDDDRLIPESQVRLLCGGVSAMATWRWDRDPEMKFPKPIIINKRKYRRLGELRRWIAERASAGKVG